MYACAYVCLEAVVLEIHHEGLPRGTGACSLRPKNNTEVGAGPNADGRVCFDDNMISATRHQSVLALTAVRSLKFGFFDGPRHTETHICNIFHADCDCGNSFEPRS